MKLNILEKFFLKRIENKASKVSGAIMAGIPGGVVWPERNYENFARETYMKNVITYRCIGMTARSVASVSWKLFRMVQDQKTDKLKREVIQSHPVNALLKRPNPRQSFPVLIQALMSYYLMSGNGFLERVGPSTGPNQKTIKELYTLRPDRMKIKTSGEGVNGYLYCVNGEEIPFDADPVTGQCDILHLKFFHPLDDFWGLAPTEPGAISIDSHNSASMWNKSLTENEARPGAIFMFENTLQDKQFKRIQKQIQDTKAGFKYAGKSLIVEGGIKDVKPYGFNPREMDWIKSNLELARNICNAWDVPPQMIGIPDTSTYANYQEARQAFWEESVIFYLELLKNEFNFWLFPGENLETESTEQPFLDYMLNDVPALAAKRDKLWERAEKTTFLKTNEKREMVDYEQVEGGDSILVSATMIPLGEEPETEEGQAEEDEKAIQKLIDQGFTREEAMEQIGVPID